MSIEQRIKTLEQKRPASGYQLWLDKIRRYNIQGYSEAKLIEIAKTSNGPIEAILRLNDIEHYNKQKLERII